MAYLSIKLDHAALLRQARRGKNPDPSHAAIQAELAGADGITVHLRRDRRHIRDKDLFVLKEIVGTRLTIEVAPSGENLSRVLEVKPYMVTFLPEREKEHTTQTGLVLDDEEYGAIEDMTRRLQEVGVKVALHIEPSVDVVKRASKIKVDAVKLHTGLYAGARTESEGLAELDRIDRAAGTAGKASLLVLAGQGLDYQNLPPLAKLSSIDEFVIGQAIVARAVMVGMEKAVRDMLALVRQDGAHAGR